MFAVKSQRLVVIPFGIVKPFGVFMIDANVSLDPSRLERLAEFKIKLSRAFIRGVSFISGKWRAAKDVAQFFESIRKCLSGTAGLSLINVFRGPSNPLVKFVMLA